MSKPHRLPASHQNYLRRPLAGLALLAVLLVPGMAFTKAADADPCKNLQRQGQGSETDSAVLRLECQVAKSREENQHLMADMLASLGRMDATIREIVVLLQAMPAPAAPVTAAPAPPVAPNAAPAVTPPPAAAPKPAPAPVPTSAPEHQESSWLPIRLDIDPAVRLAMGMVAAVAIIGVLLMGLLKQRRGNASAAAAAPTQDKGV